MNDKALLVMDTPKNGCANCIVCRESFFKTICGITGNGVSGNNERGGFPEECPLKPMPEKKKVDLKNTPFVVGQNTGWNACIDGIMGGKKQ